MVTTKTTRKRQVEVKPDKAAKAEEKEVKPEALNGNSKYNEYEYDSSDEEVVI